MIKKRSSGSIIIVVFITIFLDMLGIGVLIPLYPYLILPHSPFRIVPLGWGYEKSVVLLGWLTSIFSLTQFFSNPILGQLADKYGRKNVMFISVFGTIVGFFLFATGLQIKNLILIFFSRFLVGTTSGNVTVAQAIISDISNLKDRAKNYGVIGAAFGLGFIFGPVIGGKLSDSHLVSFFSVSTPFYFISLLGVLNLVIVYYWLPETIKQYSNKNLILSKCLSNIHNSLKIEGVKKVTPTLFLFNSGFSIFTSFFGVILANKFHFTSVKIADYFAFVGVAIVLSQIIFVRLFAKTTKDYNVLRFSIIINGLVILGYYFIPYENVALIYIIIPFLALSNALSNIFIFAVLSRITDKRHSGEVFGITTGIKSLAMGLPPLISSYLVVGNYYNILLIGSILTIISGIIFWIIFKPKQFQSMI